MGCWAPEGADRGSWAAAENEEVPEGAALTQIALYGIVVSCVDVGSGVHVCYPCPSLTFSLGAFSPIAGIASNAVLHNRQR